MRTRTKIGIGGLLLIVGLIGGAAAFRHYRGPNLYDRARRVPGTNVLLPAPCAGYFWLNNAEILYIAPTENFGMFKAVRMNTDTGQTRPQKNLPNGLMRVSPNGQWILTFPPDKQEGAWLYLLERADGKRQFRYVGYPGKELPNPVWDLTGKTMLEVTQSDSGVQMRSYPLDGPRIIPPVSLPLVSNPFLLGVTSTNHMLIRDEDHTSTDLAQRSLTLLDFPLDAGSPVRTLPVPNPDGKGEAFGDVVLSPQGDRLALIVGAHLPPPLYAPLQKLYGLFGITDPLIVRLWTCRPDGTDMRLLGGLLNPEDTPPCNLRWTPDESRLSFQFCGSLYITPAK